MEIVGFLTFVGLLIAAYSLLKPHTRLFLRIRLSLFDKFIISILSLVIILAFIVSDYFKNLEKEISVFGLSMPLSFFISAAASLMLCLITLYIYLKIRFNRLGRRKVGLFYKLAKDLISRKEYAVLTELLEDEYPRLVKYSTRLSWHNQIKTTLLTTFKLKDQYRLSSEEIERIQRILKETGEEIKVERTEPTTKTKIAGYFELFQINTRHYIGKIIRMLVREVRDKSQEQSRQILHALLSNSDFVSEMIIIRPELSLRIFEKEFDNYNDYVDEYFYQLIKNTSSLLYYEIRNNQNLSAGSHRYAILKQNAILSRLFQDCKVAERLEVYRGVGEYVVTHLQESHDKEDDPYNSGNENYEREKWKSPVFVGIRFFDIMVSEAIYQGIEDHMFLGLFFREFTKNILINADYSSKSTDGYDECGSRIRYMDLLDEIISTLTDWIEIVKHDEIRNIGISRDDYNLADGNIIIQSAIKCLVQVEDMISRDKKMPLDFKKDYVKKIIRILYELRTEDSATVNLYGNVLLNGVKFYMTWPHRKVNKANYEIFSFAFKEFDDVHYTLGSHNEKGKQLKTEIEEYLESL
jgi:hypothetical protein